MGSKAKARLDRLQRELAKRAPALPVRILTYGMPEDGLYHDKDGTYTHEEVDTFRESYQLVILAYGDWPPGDEGERVQMTWGD